MPSSPKSEFNGPETFFNAPVVEMVDLRPGQVAIAGAPHDSTHTTRFGTRYGPRGVRHASSILASTYSCSDGLVNSATGSRLLYKGDDAVVDVGDLDVFPTDVLATTDGIRRGSAEMSRQGAFAVIVGGDHYTSYPAFLGYSDALRARSPSAKVGYIHIDGHLDFNNSSPIWGDLNHGTNARRISENELVPGPNMVWIGIQGWVGHEEWDAIRRFGGTVFTHQDVTRNGIESVVRQAADIAIRGCDYIYLSLDVDVLDAAYSPGTGGVVIGGMKPIELVKAMNVLSQYPLGAMDLTEVSPNLDSTGRTISMASTALAHLLTPRLFDVVDRARS